MTALDWDPAIRHYLIMITALLAFEAYWVMHTDLEILSTIIWALSLIGAVELYSLLKNPKMKQYKSEQNYYRIQNRWGEKFHLKVYQVSLRFGKLNSIYKKEPKELPVRSTDLYSGRLEPTPYLEIIQEKLIDLLSYVQQSSTLELHIGTVWIKKRGAYRLALFLVEILPDNLMDANYQSEMVDFNNAFSRREYPRDEISFDDVHLYEFDQMVVSDDDHYDISRRMKLSLQLKSLLIRTTSRDIHLASNPKIYLFRYELDVIFEAITQALPSFPTSHRSSGSVVMGQDSYSRTILIDPPSSILHVGTVDDGMRIYERLVDHGTITSSVVVSDRNNQTRSFLHNNSQNLLDLPLVRLLMEYPLWGRDLLNLLQLQFNSSINHRLSASIVQFLDKLDSLEIDTTEMTASDLLQPETYRGYKIDLSGEVQDQLGSVLSYPGFQSTAYQDLPLSEILQKISSVTFEIHNVGNVQKKILATTIFLLKQYRLLPAGCWLVLDVSSQEQLLESYYKGSTRAHSYLPHEIFLMGEYLDMSRNKSWMYHFDTYSASSDKINRNYLQFFGNANATIFNSILIKQHERLYISRKQDETFLVDKMPGDTRSVVPTTYEVPIFGPNSTTRRKEFSKKLLNYQRTILKRLDNYSFSPFYTWYLQKLKKILQRIKQFFDESFYSREVIAKIGERKHGLALLSLIIFYGVFFG